MWGSGRTLDGTVFNHGFGWDQAQIGGHAVLEFDGSWQGFRSAIERDPAARLTVVILANLAEASADQIARQVLIAITGFGRH